MRNFLFGPPGAGGFDLAALNIQRGRDHGLASYNQTRSALGLPPPNSVADVSARADVQARLAAAYESVDDIDLWSAPWPRIPRPAAWSGRSSAPSWSISSPACATATASSIATRCPAWSSNTSISSVCPT